MEGSTFFLGVIAVSSVVVAIWVTVVSAALLKLARQASAMMGEMEEQGRMLSMRVQAMVSGFQSVTSIVSYIVPFFSKKPKESE